MDPNMYANFLLTHMKNAKYASGKKFINCRCPECGDSVHMKSAHMYISIPWANNSVSWYYCHKCNCSGTVTFKKLIEWDIYDADIAEELEDLNKRCITNGKQSKYYNRTVYNIRNNYTTEDDRSKFKLNYICERVGYNLNYEDLNKLKIVLNLNDLLRENRIANTTRNINIVNDLDREFIGFLSVDNAFLNMRRTCEEGRVYQSIDKRYINYKLFNKDDTTQRFYTIPTMVNVNVPYRIPLHIAEGPFDILSIFLNLRKQQPGIYTSVAGSNYIAVIMFFLIDLRLPNIELHIYPDNDKQGTDERMWKIINKLPDPTIPVFVHRNRFNNEKDFGVPANRIDETITQFR